MPKNVISLAQAVEMTKRYRDNKEAILAPSYQGKDILPICETFDREAFDMLLGNAECKKLRAYLGMDANDQVRVIVVGVNDQDEDMLPSAAAARGNGDGDDDEIIIEDGIRCPVVCPPSSVLNGEG